MTEELARRIAILVRLVEKAPGHSLGRTAAMKLLFFLTALRRVPLGYRFTLYSYGPFDSTVLADIDYAVHLGGLQSTLVSYPSGYGYSIEPGASAHATIALNAGFVTEHEAAIDWVIAEFGHMSAADLELAGTIVYVDQQFARRGPADVDTLATEVRDVKPHFARDRILHRIDQLRASGYLRSV